MHRLPVACIAVALALGVLVGCSAEDFDLDESGRDGDGSITIEGNVVGDEVVDCGDLTEGTTPDCTGPR